MEFDWEQVFIEQFNRAGIVCYPLQAPLNADTDTGHVVYTQINENKDEGYDGDIVYSVVVELDCRAKQYSNARKLLSRALEVLKVKGKGKQCLMLNKDTIITLHDNTLGLFRFQVDVDINPYFLPLDPILGARAFSRAFGRSYG